MFIVWNWIREHRPTILNKIYSAFLSQWTAEKRSCSTGLWKDFKMWTYTYLRSLKTSLNHRGLRFQFHSKVLRGTFPTYRLLLLCYVLLFNKNQFNQCFPFLKDSQPKKMLQNRTDTINSYWKRGVKRWKPGWKGIVTLPLLNKTPL